MKPIAIIAIIAAVVVVGGACAGVAFSGVLNGGTTGPGGDDPAVPTDPVEPTPTETPTETPTDSSMSYFSPMTSSGSSGSGTSQHTHTWNNDVWAQDDMNHWHATTCDHDVKKDEATHDYGEGFNCADGGECTICGYERAAGDHTWGEWGATPNVNEYSRICSFCLAEETEVFLGITNADELLAFAAAVNENGDTYNDKTVKLMSDIDLAGITWKPIGNVSSYPSVTFAGTFDGQDHTISNMNVEVSGDGGDATGGFFGSITGEVLNLNIDRATIKSSHYAGGIVGYSSANVGMKIENCKVTNSNITSTPELLADDKYDNGDKVGGIIGYMVAGDTVTGCTVENTKIIGYRDIGGIVGYSAGTVTGNTAKDVVLVINNDHNYKNYADIDDHDAGGVVGEIADGGSADNTNTATNVTIKKVFTSSEALADKIKEASVVDVELLDGPYSLPKSISNKDLTITGSKDVVIEIDSAIGANGSNITFDGVTVKFDNDNYEGFQHSTKVVYMDCTIIGQQTLYAPATEFTDCTFTVEGDYYSVWTYGTNPIFTRCTFNCDGKAVLVYTEGAVTNTVTFNECTFNDNGDDTVSKKAAVEVGESAYGNKATYTIIINDCTVNGFDITEQKSETIEGANLGTNVWGNKNLMPAERLNVVIDGTEVY